MSEQCESPQVAETLMDEKKGRKGGSNSTGKSQTCQPRPRFSQA